MKKKLQYKILLTTLIMASSLHSTGCGREEKRSTQIIETLDDLSGLVLEASIDSLLTASSLHSTEGSREEKKGIKIIETLDDLNGLFPEASIDSLSESLAINTKISDKYRKYTEQFIHFLSLRFSNADVTIFNENIKSFPVYNISEEAMNKDRKKSRLSFYRPSENAIYMLDQYESEEVEKYCFFHELWHLFHTMYKNVNGIIVYRDPAEGYTALDEGMITLLTELIFDGDVKSSYHKQYDEVSILYEIYHEELLDRYFEKGSMGILDLLTENTNNKQEAYNFIHNMEKELDGTLDNPCVIYEYLISLCKEDTNYVAIYQIIENTLYSDTIKKQLLQSLSSSLPTKEINNDTKIQFDNGVEEYIYNLSFMEIKGEVYLVNNQLLQNYFATGTIQNIYDDEVIFIGIDSIYARDTLYEYLNLSNIEYEYDEATNTIYITGEQIRGDIYVKSK